MPIFFILAIQIVISIFIYLFKFLRKSYLIIPLAFLMFGSYVVSEDSKLARVLKPFFENNNLFTAGLIISIILAATLLIRKIVTKVKKEIRQQQLEKRKEELVDMQWEYYKSKGVHGEQEQIKL